MAFDTTNQKESAVYWDRELSKVTSNVEASFICLLGTGESYGLTTNISTRLYNLLYTAENVYNEIKNKVLPPYVNSSCHKVAQILLFLISVILYSHILGTAENVLFKSYMKLTSYNYIVGEA